MVQHLMFCRFEARLQIILASTCAVFYDTSLLCMPIYTKIRYYHQEYYQDALLMLAWLWDQLWGKQVTLSINIYHAH